MNEECKKESENRKKWHTGEKIPIATIVVLVMQTVAVVWWAASISARVDYMKEATTAAQIIQATIDRKQDENAQREENRILIQLDKINVKLDILADKVHK